MRDAEVKIGGSVVALLVLIGALAAFRACQPSDADLANGTSHDARVVCEDFVSRRLKAPSTADVTTLDTAVMVAPGQWRSKGSFDAQNGFGAKIRGYFVCDVKHTEGDRYDLVALSMK